MSGFCSPSGDEVDYSMLGYHTSPTRVQASLPVAPEDVDLYFRGDTEALLRSLRSSHRWAQHQHQGGVFDEEAALEDTVDDAEQNVLAKTVDESIGKNDVLADVEEGREVASPSVQDESPLAGSEYTFGGSTGSASSPPPARRGGHPDRTRTRAGRGKKDSRRPPASSVAPSSASPGSGSSESPPRSRRAASTRRRPEGGLLGARRLVKRVLLPLLRPENKGRPRTRARSRGSSDATSETSYNTSATSEPEAGAHPQHRPPQHLLSRKEYKRRVRALLDECWHESASAPRCSLQGSGHRAEKRFSRGESKIAKSTDEMIVAGAVTPPSAAARESESSTTLETRSTIMPDDGFGFGRRIAEQIALCRQVKRTRTRVGAHIMESSGTISGARGRGWPSAGRGSRLSVEAQELGVIVEENVVPARNQPQNFTTRGGFSASAVADPTQTDTAGLDSSTIPKSETRTTPVLPGANNYATASCPRSDLHVQHSIETHFLQSLELSPILPRGDEGASRGTGSSGGLVEKSPSLLDSPAVEARRSSCRRVGGGDKLPNLHSQSAAAAADACLPGSSSWPQEHAAFPAGYNRESQARSAEQEQNRSSAMLPLNYDVTETVKLRMSELETQLDISGMTGCYTWPLSSTSGHSSDRDSDPDLASSRSQISDSNSIPPSRTRSSRSGTGSRRSSAADSLVQGRTPTSSTTQRLGSRRRMAMSNARSVAADKVQVEQQKKKYNVDEDVGDNEGETPPRSCAATNKQQQQMLWREYLAEKFRAEMFYRRLERLDGADERFVELAKAYPSYDSMKQALANVDSEQNVPRSCR